MSTSTCSPSFSTDPRTDAYQAALLYRDIGWSVLPVFQKEPAVPRWKPFQRRPPSEAELHKMFSARRPIDGVAVIPGPVSRWLCVRDFDDVVA